VIAPALFTSTTDLWATPAKLFAELSRKYGPFDVDVCAVAENAKCPRYFSPEVDGLQQHWEGRCWCNPPYGKTIGQWICKAWKSSLEGATVVMLLPARVDTRWWHTYIKPYAAKIDFLRAASASATPLTLHRSQAQWWCSDQCGIAIVNGVNNGFGLPGRMHSSAQPSADRQHTECGVLRM